MIDPNKLQYFTTASWLRGYASGLAETDEYKYLALIHRMNQAADLLDTVWLEHVKQTEQEEQMK